MWSTFSAREERVHRAKRIMSKPLLTFLCIVCLSGKKTLLATLWLLGSLANYGYTLGRMGGGGEIPVPLNPCMLH